MARAQRDQLPKDAAAVSALVTPLEETRAQLTGTSEILPVMRGLLSSGVKFAPEGGTITVSTGREPDALVVYAAVGTITNVARSLEVSEVLSGNREQGAVRS
jgi:hypothetical protein